MAQETLAFHVKPRGFAAMSLEQHKQIASQGGKAAHAAGTAHRYTAQTAAEAGANGGKKHSREHMRELGRKGGNASGEARLGLKRVPFELVIECEDKGQQVRRFVVRRMAVVDWGPYRNPTFEGARLAVVPKVGELIRFKRRHDNRWLTFRFVYPVAKVERRQVKEVQS